MMDAEADLIRKDQAVDSFSGVNFWTCNLAIWQTAFIYLYPCTNDFYFEDAGFLIAMFDYHQNEQQRCGLWRRDQDLVCNQLILRRSKHHSYEPWDKSSFIGAIPSITGVISVVTQLPGGMILQVLPSGWFPTAMPKDPAASQVLLWLPLLPQEGGQGVGKISQGWRFFPCRRSRKF